MAGAWKQVKTNNRFSPVPTPPWESGKPRRIPTFPPRPLLLPLLKPKRQKQERNRPLRGLRFRIFFRITLYWKRYLISGSSDDWNMLSSQAQVYKRGIVPAFGFVAYCQPEPQT
jgi:hypothetical protein